MLNINNEIRAYGTEFSTKGILVTGRDTFILNNSSVLCIQSMCFPFVAREYKTDTQDIIIILLTLYFKFASVLFCSCWLKI